MPRFVLFPVVAWLFLLGLPAAWACTICAPVDAQNTLSHQLWAASSVVLAQPGPPGQGMTVVASLKGIAPPSLPPPLSTQSPSREPEEVQLLLLSGGSQAWRTVGAFPAKRMEWLRGFISLGRASDTAAQDWPGRLAFLAKSLEDPNPLIAQATYEEISAAPYTAMRSLKPVLDRAALERWLGAPSLAARRPLYALLLGLVGDEATGQVIQARLQATGPSLAPADVSALLAALIEIRGGEALTWIEQHYLTDAGRPDSDLQAVLMALSVHGADGQRISRERIVAAYATWVRVQRPRAGLVASDLAAWGRWEFGPAFAAILQSGEAMSFASRYAMVLYLMRSPRPEARQALQALQASGRL